MLKEDGMVNMLTFLEQSQLASIQASSYHQANRNSILGGYTRKWNFVGVFKTRSEDLS